MADRYQNKTQLYPEQFLHEEEMRLFQEVRMLKPTERKRRLEEEANRFFKFNGLDPHTLGVSEEVKRKLLADYQNR
jgi:hypothetical protein